MSQLLVPYYEHPTVRPAEWAAILAAAPRLYGVILNPASGPGEAPDPAFADLAAQLRATDVRLLGYTDTAYGSRPYADIAQDLTRYHDWYGTNGAFFDQVPTAQKDFRHYQRLASAAWATGCGTLVLNHGTTPHPSYARIADVLITFEGPWTTYRQLPPQPWPGTKGTHLGHLVYGVPPEVDFEAAARARGASVHCAVPGVGDHPWGTLPHTLEPVP